MGEGILVYTFEGNAPAVCELYGVCLWTRCYYLDVVMYYVMVWMFLSLCPLFCLLVQELWRRCLMGGGVRPRLYLL